MSRRTRHNDRRILGVTLATPAFYDLAVEAMKRWTLFTGQAGVILTGPEGPDAHWEKLRIPQMLPDQDICFFDADLWFQRPCRPWEILASAPNCFHAMPDPGIANKHTFAHADCAAFKLDPDCYFNSGIFLCNTNTAAYAFDEAIKIQHSRAARKKLADFGEQTALNFGVQRTMHFHPLPPEWNVGPWLGIAGLQPSLPGQPIALHAMGCPAGIKRERLELWERAFSPSLAPDLAAYAVNKN